MTRFRHIHHADGATIAHMYAEYAPVFVLTTGRSASQFLVRLLQMSPGVAAHHEPAPTLQYFANYAYQHQRERPRLQAIIDAARMELVLESVIREQIYVEANQCLTFFAPGLAGLFRAARFVHLVRHPGAFVRSAVRKGWYVNDSIWEAGRPRLADEALWRAMEQVERLAWLWSTTQRFIRSFTDTLDPERVLRLTSERLTSDLETVARLVEFVGGGAVASDSVTQLQQQRVNALTIDADEPSTMRKAWDFPPYDEWPPAMRESLRLHCAAEASAYHYPL